MFHGNAFYQLSEICLKSYCKVCFQHPSVPRADRHRNLANELGQQVVTDTGYRISIEPAQYFMGKMGIKSMKVLGVTPKSCSVEIVNGHIVMTISAK